MRVYKDADGDWKMSQPPSTASVLRVIGMALGVVVLLVVAFTSYYTVGPEEKAVVLRFGRYHSTTDSGLHFKMPFGVDRAINVPVRKVHKLEFGFGTLESGVRTTYRPATKEDENVSLMLTGDLNIISLEWVVQYEIQDPKAWVFHVRNQVAAIRDLSEAAMRAVVGDHTIDEVLQDRTTIAAKCRDELESLLRVYDAGVRVVTVELQDVEPPGPVQQSFNDVNKAQQERSQLENEAKREYNRVIPREKGEAKRTVEAAEGYAVDRVNRAHGDVARFNELLKEYTRSKEVTRQRIYLELVEEVLPNVRRIVVASDEGVLKMLPLEGSPGGGK